MNFAKYLLSWFRKYCRALCTLCALSIRLLRVVTWASGILAGPRRLLCWSVIPPLWPPSRMSPPLPLWPHGWHPLLSCHLHPWCHSPSDLTLFAVVILPLLLHIRSFRQINVNKTYFSGWVGGWLDFWWQYSIFSFQIWFSSWFSYTCSQPSSNLPCNQGVKGSWGFSGFDWLTAPVEVGSPP